MRTVIGLVLVFSTVTAHADARGWVDEDAGLIATVELSALSEVVDVVPLPWPAVRAMAKDTLGFDPLAAKEWSRGGIAPDAVLTFTAAFNERDGTSFMKAAKREFKKKQWNLAAPHVRFRLSVPVKDEKKARTWVKGVATRAPFLKPLGDAAVALGGYRAVRGWEKQGVLALGRMPSGGFGFVRVSKNWLVVDVLIPVVDGGARRALVRHINKGLATKPIKSAVWKDLEVYRKGAHVSFVIRPRQFVHLFQSKGYGNILGALAQVAKDDRAPLFREGMKEIATCGKLLSVVDRGAFRAYGIGAHFAPRAVSLTGGWLLQPKAKKFLAQLRPGGPRVKWGRSPVAAARFAFHPATAGLALDKPAFLKDPQTAAETVQMCGAAGYLVLGIFGWPQVAAAAMEEWGSPASRRMLRSFVGFGFAAKSVGADTEGYVAGVAAPYKDFEPSLARLLNQQPSDTDVRGVKLRLWRKVNGDSFAFAYEESGWAVAGIGNGTGTLKWHVDGVAPGSADLMEFHIDAARVIAAAGDGRAQSGPGKWLKGFSKISGRMNVELGALLVRVRMDRTK